MPLRLTSAPVAGIQKKRKSTFNNTLRPRPSPFANYARTKTRDTTTTTTTINNTPKQADEYDNDDEVADLPDQGPSNHIPQTSPVHNVPQALHYIYNTMFDDLPATRPGMNSTRIAEVLNFRRSLPPLASVAHVHMLLDAPTRTEREIVELVRSGRVRRLVVPGRGGHAAGLGDCLVLGEDLEGLVRGSGLEEALKGGYISMLLLRCDCIVNCADKFLHVLKHMGSSSAIPPGIFSPEEYQSLLRAGFLVSSSSLAKGSASVASLPNLPSTSTHSSASRADRNDYNTTPSAKNDTRFHTAILFLSLPNTGPYLRLLHNSRAHLLSLLKKSSSSSREAPLYLLRDRWDGAIETDKSFHVAKRARGERAGILPGRTKKWKDLYGMRFRWVLEEALGAGLVEAFETGSVGVGVRCL